MQPGTIDDHSVRHTGIPLSESMISELPIPAYTVLKVLLSHGQLDKNTKHEVASPRVDVDVSIHTSLHCFIEQDCPWPPCLGYTRKRFPHSWQVAKWLGNGAA